jgi:2-polyprenyl-6-methoxyphenol hydroxylase-like FAD-dependent oxidoreductase
MEYRGGVANPDEHRAVVRGGGRLGSGPSSSTARQGGAGCERENMARVMIIGAGLAGLSAARALAGYAHDCVLLERERVFPHLGAGITLHGNGVRALGALGITPTAAGRVQSSMRIRDASSGETSIDLSDIWRDVAPTIAAHRRDLHHVLRQTVADLPIRMGATLTGLHAYGDTVSVTLSTGEELICDLVIGADGIYSTVRRLHFGELPLRCSGEQYWRAVVPSAGIAAVDSWTIWRSRELMCGIVPIAEGRSHMFIQRRARDWGEDPVQGRMARVAALLCEHLAPELAEAISSTADGDIHFSNIQELGPAWSRGNVVLVGDAAHAISPLLSEGACMAFEDAVVLADCLAQESSPQAALTRYSTRRSPRIEWLRRMTRLHVKAAVWPVPDDSFGVAAARLMTRTYTPLREAP